MDDQLLEAGIAAHDIAVGDNRLIVVYSPGDTGIEIDAVALFEAIGADAADRAADGWELASLDTLNLRHAGLYLGRDGSGYETKAAVTALFTRSGS